jgi:hypothetical protein
MEPSDPKGEGPVGAPIEEASPSPEGPSDTAKVEFVDFAETEPVEPRDEGDVPTSPRQFGWLLLLPFGFTFLLTCLFLAMRGVMDLGGMVAIGGPYEIAHPAPGYWWIFPVSVIGCVLITFMSMGMFSAGRGKASLVALFFWPAIFLSLGWNFCEYGFFNTEGLIWGWIVCGVVFVVMGGLPLYLVMRKITWSGLLEAIKSNARTLWPQLLGIAVGIPLGILFFRAVS